MTITPAPDEAPRLAFGFAVRNAIGAAIPLVAGVIVDDVTAGAVAGGGAIVVGFADVGDTKAHRAVAMLATGLLAAVSTAVGVLASDSELASLVVTGLWGVGAGLAAAGGPIVGTVALSATIALLVFAGNSTGSHAELELAAFTFAGGALQTALGLLVPTRSGYPLHAHPLAELRRAVSAALSWAHPIGRHAVRLGLALSAATAVYRLLPVDRGYWIPLTVLFVMRPEAARTRTRIVQRFLGTVLGVVAITLVVSLLEPGALVLALLCAAFLVPAYAYLWIDYTRFTVGIAGAAVALAALLGLPEPTAALDRFLDTIVGLAIIVFLLALLPELPRRAPTPRE